MFNADPLKFEMADLVPGSDLVFRKENRKIVPQTKLMKI